jgi:hypothetical protein
VNLQTEIKKRVLIDNEYLSFRWTGGFEESKNPINPNTYNNNNFNNNNNNKINNDFNF